MFITLNKSWKSVNELKIINIEKIQRKKHQLKDL